GNGADNGEEEDDRNQVDEHRQCLHEIHQWFHGFTDGVVGCREDTQWDGDEQRDNGGEYHLRQGLHRFVEIVHAVDETEGDQREQRHCPAAHEERDHCQDQEHAPRWEECQYLDEKIDTVVHHERDEVPQQAEAAAEPIDRGVDPVGQRNVRYVPRFLGGSKDTVTHRR